MSKFHCKYWSLILLALASWLSFCYGYQSGRGDDLDVFMFILVLFVVPLAYPIARLLSYTIKLILFVICKINNIIKDKAYATMNRLTSIKRIIFNSIKRMLSIRLQRTVDLSEFIDWKNHIELFVCRIVGIIVLIVLYFSLGDICHNKLIQYTSAIYLPIKKALLLEWYTSVPLALCVFLLFSVYLYKRLRDKIGSLRRIFVFTVLAYIFSDWELFDATYVCGDFSFLHLLKILFGICIVIETYKCLPRIIKKKYRNKGFPTDAIIKTEAEVHPVRAKFAQEVFSKLIETDVHEDAYALAILGHWGSGKSSFMNILRQKARAEQYAWVDFNPWTTFAASSVDELFIATLKGILQVHSINVVKLFNKYAKAISTVKKKLQIIPAAVEPFVESVDSIDSIKKKIICKLSLLPKPIFIFIDDLDRMKEREIFEVLKLVRNTFNFPNLIYVVSLDKDYVSDQLCNIGINDGHLFLEKIFPAEIYLPAIDDVDIIETMQNEIMAMIKYKNDILSVFSKFNETEREHIAKILKTYRGAKHFARQFAIVFEMARHNLETEGINYRDLLLLELLKRVDSHTYDVLTYDPEEILGEPIIGINVYNYYVFHKESPSQMNSSVKWLLGSLFMGEPEGNRIGNCVYYSQYFSFGIRKLNVSQKKFTEILSAPVSSLAKNGIYQSLRHLLTKPVRVDAKSLYDLFMNKKNIPKSKDSINRFFIAFFTWMEFETNPIICRVLLHIVSHKTYAKKDLQIDIKNSFIENCTNMLKRTRNNSLISSWLSGVYQKSKIGECILTKDNIKSLLIINCQQVLKRKTWEPISVVKEDGNELNQLVENSCLYKEEDKNDIIVNKENAVIEYLLTYFKKHTGTHLDQALDALQLSMDDLKKDFLYQDRVPHVVEKVFNDPTGEYKLLKKFLDACFVSYKESLSETKKD